MSNYSIKMERRCRCGKIFQTTDAEMAQGLGRYCGDECLEKSTETETGTIFLFNYKPRGAAENSRTYDATVWLQYPKYTRYKYRHYDYRFIGNPKDQKLYQMIWEGSGTVKCKKDLPWPVPFKELEILFTEIFKHSPEAMFQAILTAGIEELELLVIQAKLVS